ncbi:heterokaryon incompatibility protein-domain-containing protein, partial [Alternaria rosae]|uniref:heterokaryon incompatibility protein-domain-containing protein n=1 Tax=Alternaria rosae TaxID=1187941 RepID=UPI001E8D3C6D
MALSCEPRVRRHSYAALEGPEHIRLLVLHPALSKDAPLRVDFVSSTLENLEGRYDAISYTWSQPILSFALLLDDGTQVCVTENLDGALRYLRYNDRDRLLWADAACINQLDNAEKAVQIPLMVDIFRGAQRVMAWLDPGGDTTVEQTGMRIIERLSRTSKQRYIIWARGYREVTRFINLPWFNRLWIVQEVVFSSEVCLICGDTEIAFPRFIAALSFVQEELGLLNDDDRARVDAIVKIGRLWSRRSLFPTQLLGAPLSPSRSDIDSNDITNLVEKFALYACTDPRDRVFALFSMAANIQPAGYVSDILPSSASQEQGAVSISIDYSLDVLETYKAFA